MINFSSAFAQNCLPEGLIIAWGQYTADDFHEDYPDCTCILGDVIVNSFANNDSIHKLLQITEIKGNFRIESIDLKDNELSNFDNLTKIGGSFEIYNIKSEGEIDGFKSLEEIGGDFFIEFVDFKEGSWVNSSGFASSFPKLNRVGSRMVVDSKMDPFVGFSQLNYVGSYLYAGTRSYVRDMNYFNAVDTVIGYFGVNVGSFIDSVSLPKLKYVGDDIRVWNNSNLELISFDSLSYLGGDISMWNCENIEAPISMPMLERVKGSVKISDIQVAPKLFDFPQLRKIDGALRVLECEGVLDFEGLPSLEVIGGHIKVMSNSSMESFDGLASIDSIVGEIIISSTPIKSLSEMGNTLTYLWSLNGTGALKNLHGFEKLESLALLWNINYLFESFEGLDSSIQLGTVRFSSFTRMKHLKGLENIEKVYALIIEDNQYIESLEGLDKVSGMKRLTLKDNENLNLCATDWMCNNMDSIEILTIDNNGDECITSNKVKDICKRRYKIFLESYYDINENGIREDNENLIIGPSYTIFPQDNFAHISNPAIPFLHVPEGEYVVGVAQETYDDWELLSSTNEFLVALDSLNTSIVLQFGFLPKVLNTSTSINLISNSMRCNTFGNLEGSIKNTGNTILSGTNYLKINSLIDSISFEIDPDIIVGDSIFGWNFNDVYPGYVHKYKMNFKVPGPLDFEIGDKLNFLGYAEFSDQEGTEYLEEENYSETIRCSYDPNDKASNPLYLDQYTLIGEEITYKIRFQNTGNDEAYDIVIRDTLDENLDLSTFEVIDCSHPFVLSTQLNRETRAVSFAFNNIYLPDSTTNEPESHGHLIYSIFPNADIEDNTMIENKAFIYFDFNPAIITNTTQNILVDELPTLNTISHNEIVLEVYTNPVDYSLTFKSDTSIEKIEFYDIQGRLLKTVINPDSIVTLHVNDLNSGLYFVSVKTQEGLVKRKLVVK